MTQTTSQSHAGHRIRAEQVEVYRRDGLLRIPGLFEAQELEPLRRALREDPSVNGSAYGMVDEEGRPHPICIWTEFGDDIVGAIPRMARVVDAVEALLGERCYHWHSKLTIKPPGCRARVDWHQDYGSWYDDGVLFPDMLTVSIALEPATKANGCTQFIPGSHRMGRIDHGAVDGEFKQFYARLEKAREALGLVHGELEVGDAIFFHCNLLHGSGANESDTPRPLFFSSYNAVSNGPVPGAQGANEEGAFMNITPAERAVRPLEKLPDDVLRKRRYASAFHHTPFKQPRRDLGESHWHAEDLDAYQSSESRINGEVEQ